MQKARIQRCSVAVPFRLSYHHFSQGSRNMKLQKLLVGFSFLSVGLTLSATSAQAFTFQTNLAPGSSDPKGNIWLESVTLNDDTVFSDFSFVSGAQIVHNDLYTGGNTGAASSDRGDEADGVKLEKATNESIVQSLGNNNLNNIIDGEDQGSFVINVSFEKAVSSLFFWERGMNSRLGVQALDTAGNLIGNFLTLDSRTWKAAGFSIDTTEIGGAQRVGSLGVSLADLGVTGPISAIQLTSRSNFNGPDFKVIGGAAPQAVPEPTTMAGLALAGAGFAAARRRRQQA